MAVNDRFITNLEAAPLVETDVFENDLSKKFAIVAFEHGIRDNDEVFRGYLKLRANVYVHQTGMLDPEYVRPDGTERDEDDERSSHFVVLENRIGRAAVVGCLRLIEKSPDNPAPLPIEQFFPAAFENQPAGQKSLEVSRFISSIDNRAHQLVAIMELFKSGLARIKQQDLGPTYGIVEEDLEKSLAYLGAPPRRIADPEYLEEYHDKNVGIEIDTDKMMDTMGAELISSLDVTHGAVRYWGRLPKESANGKTQKIA